MLVSDIIEDARQAFGKCDLDELLPKITDAITVLANKAQYDVLTGYVDICSTSDGRFLTLPRGIDTVLALNAGGHPKLFRNRWLEFHTNGPGTCPRLDWVWEDRGDFPVVMDIKKFGEMIAVADLKTDLGASLRVIGYDDKDHWIRTQERDGTWKDGFLVPINLLTDFPNSVIVPDANRIFVRDISVDTITTFMSSVPHDFINGSPVVLATVTSPLPTPLVEGGAYFVRVIDSDSLELFATLSDSLTGSNPIKITSASALSEISLTDTRAISAKTQFESSSDHNLQTGNLIQFTATTLPVPLVDASDYYARVIDATHFTAHATLQDAEDGVNFVDVSTPGSVVKVRALLEMKPTTFLQFSVSHNMIQGDAVTVANSGGELPAPLLQGVTYFVRVINATKLTLHQTLADATSGANPIILTTAGTGTNALIKQLPATAALGPTNNITATGHNLSTGDFVQFTTTGTLPAPLAQGSVYEASTPSSSDTFTLANTGLTTKTTATRSRFNNVATLVTGAAHGFSTGDVVDIEGVGGTGYNASQVTITVVNTTAFTYTNTGTNEQAAVTSASRARVSNISTIVTGSAHGYTTGDVVDISGIGGTGYNATLVAIVVTNSTTFVYTNPGGNEGTTADTGGSIVKHIADTGGSIIKGRVNITSLGAGQLLLIISRSFFLGFFNQWNVDATNIATGSAVVFETDGAFPSTTPALDTSTTRYARKISDTLIELFESSAHASDPAIRTSTSRSRTSNVAEIICSAAHGFIAGDVIDVSGMSGTGYNATRMTVLSAGLTSTNFRYNNTGSNEGSTADTGGQIVFSNIKVNSLGAGKTFLVLERSITAEIRSSVLNLPSPQYLKDGATVQLQTDGTLPAPLTVLTNYKLSLQTDGVQLLTSGGSPITLTNIGSGAHTFTITSDFSVEIPTSFIVLNNSYDDGDAVLFETEGVAPDGLVSGTIYYIRRLNDNEIELYDTEAHAKDTSSVVGRIVANGTGSGAQKITQTLPNFKVKRVERIVKSLTNGFIQLFCWDTGRTDNLAFMGRYYPDELQPAYRRIRLGSCNSWVRIRFRRSIFELRSLDDFIPFKSRMPLLTMFKAIKFLRNDDLQTSLQYEAKAEMLLNEEQGAHSTPGSTPIQVDAAVTTRPYDQMT